MATHTVNRDAVAHARELIDAKQYVLDSDWGDVQPDAEAQNAYLTTCSSPRSDRGHRDVRA